MMTSQDFEKGVDFTALGNAAAGDHNNLVDMANPVLDSGSEGKGIVLCSYDSALDTPRVPDPEQSPAFNKWVRYIWLRVPFAGAAIKNPAAYGWNNDSPLDPVFLRWHKLSEDLTAINAIIATMQADITTAQNTADNASTQAGTAATQAGAALTSATNAVTTANAAAANATTANTNAIAAQTTADNAQAQANTALAAANAAKAPTAALTPGTPFQEIRTNISGNGVEWFSQLNNYVKVSETQAKGVDAGDAVIGKNTRVFDTKDFDAGALGDIVTTPGVLLLAAGTYRCNALVTASRKSSQALLVNHGTNATILTGTSFAWSSGQMNCLLSITGVFTLATATKVRIDHYFAGNQTNGLGEAANVHPDGGGKEVYVTAEFWRIGI